MNESVAIIILNYNDDKDTIECIYSLGIVAIPYHIFLVDNGSNKIEPELIKLQKQDNLTFIETGKNLGFAGGNNIGLKKAVEEGYRYFCILNNDTIANEDFLTPCINQLKNDSRLAFVSPTIIDYYNKDVQVAGSSVNAINGKTVNFNSHKLPEQLPTKIYCDYISGACIVCSIRTINEVGFLPEAYFLYYEETEWCYRAEKKFKRRNVCLGNVFIQHKGSVSVNKIGGLQDYMSTRNRVVFIRRNSPSHLLGFLYYLYLCLKEIIKFHLRGRKQIYKERLKAFQDGWHKKIDMKYPFVIIRE